MRYWIATEPSIPMKKVMMFIAAEISKHHHLHSSTFFHPNRIYKTVRIRCTAIPPKRRKTGVKLVLPFISVMLTTENRYQVIEVTKTETIN